MLSTDPIVFLVIRHNFFDEILIVTKLGYLIVRISCLFIAFSTAHVI